MRNVASATGTSTEVGDEKDCADDEEGGLLYDLVSVTHHLGFRAGVEEGERGEGV